MLGQLALQAQLALPLTRSMSAASSVAQVAKSAKSAVPSALTGTPQKLGYGLFSLLGFGGARVHTPLTEPLPDMHITHTRSSLSAKPSLVSSALPNGAKLATINSTSPVSTLAVFINAGSVYESGTQTGATAILTRLAFKATKNRTTFRLTRELEKLGINAHTISGRDHIGYALEYVRLFNREAAELLVDSVCNQRLNYWEVREVLGYVKKTMGQALQNPANVLSEVLHRAAYDGPLSQPLNVDPALIPDIDDEDLRAFRDAHFHPSKMVFAGVGVEHSDVKEWLSPLLGAVGAGGASSSANAIAPPASKSKYVGGGISVLAPSSGTHFALGFEAKGGLSDPKTEALANVVAALLEETRATLPRLRKDHDVFNTVGSFVSLYKDTGVVGLAASSSSQQAGQLVDAVSKKLEVIAKGVSDAALANAKQVVLGLYAQKLATTPGLLSLVGPHMLVNGSFNADDFRGKVSALTAKEVSEFVAHGLKSAPTFVSYGSLATVPRYEAIARRFN